MAILASAVLFGRAFCGWACPGGLPSEFVAKLSLMKGKVTGTVDKVLSSGKYVVLAGSAVVFFLMNNPRWAIPIRTGEFFNSVGLTFEHADSLWIVRTIFVLVGLGFGIVIPAFWCRYLCPTGGVLGALNRFPLVRYFKTNTCNDCDGERDEDGCIECTDEDEDGFSPVGGFCGRVDCDDSDSAIHPGATETPGDGIDSNCNGSDDCFIATAAYGSPLDERIDALRRFRDEVLMSNAMGRHFVTWYYRASPPIAEFIEKHEALRKIVRWSLGPAIFFASLATE